jgi:hypothetical protein
MGEPLSGTEVHNMCMKFGLDINIVKNPPRGSNVSDFMTGRDGTIVLLVWGDDGNHIEGHWVTLFRRGNQIQYYDSYGESPEQYLDKHPELRKKFGIVSSICRALVEAELNGVQVRYNEFDQQGHQDGKFECGYHCIFRLLHRNLNEYGYNDLVNNIVEDEGYENINEMVVDKIQEGIKRRCQRLN